ncbi:hypothetical protein ACPWSR_06875 [Alloiococcus sp. CFN-8]|uniref:hypothetical protein n=1 Tax=Alloiococcus sp. CFN-8 TaxID=3416081 RepID=UPI003CF3EFAB
MENKYITISKEAIDNALGIIAIILYWTIYIWQEKLSTVGDYRYFPYGLHEVFSIGYLLVPAITFIWLTRILIRIRKKEYRKKNRILIISLSVLLILQIGYVQKLSQLVNSSILTEAVEIPDEFHIVINRGEGTVTLSTTPLVTALIKTDGTRYIFNYDFYKDTPNEGRLNYISQAGE